MKKIFNCSKNFARIMIDSSNEEFDNFIELLGFCISNEVQNNGWVSWETQRYVNARFDSVLNAIEKQKIEEF